MKRACDPAAPSTLKVEMSWIDDPAASGTRIYRTLSGTALAFPGSSGAAEVSSCDDPPASATPWFYTVVGVWPRGMDGPA